MRTTSGLLVLLLTAYLTACAGSTTESQFVSSDTGASAGADAPSPDRATPDSATPLAATAAALAPTDTLPSPATSTPPPPSNPTAKAPPADTPTSIPTQTASPPPTATPTQPGDTTADGGSHDELVARGIEVYRANFCGTCHTLDAADTHGIFGPAHNGVGTTAAQRIQDAEYTGSATTAEAYIRESLVDPSVYRVPGYSGGRFTMPTYSELDEADLDALIYMLLHQK